MEELDYIDLDLSYVLDWYLDSEDLVFELDACLLPEHREYQKPRKNEIGYYKKATLVFVAPSNIEGLLQKQQVKPSRDPDNTKDFGEMGEIAVSTTGKFGISGDYGNVLISGAKLKFSLDV